MLINGKNFFFRRKSKLIVVLTILFISGVFNCSLFAQDSPIVYDNTSYNKSEPTLTRPEKHLVKVLKATDSLYNIDKVSSLVYLNNNVDTTSIGLVRNELKAAYLHTYGKLLVENGKPKVGIDTLLSSLKLKKYIYGNADSRLAKTYNYIGIAHFRMHDYEDALNNYFKSIEILTVNQFYGRDLFDAYQNIGIVKASLGNFEDAYVFFERASDIIQKGPAADSVAIARFYSNYGLLATLMGKMEQANLYFDVSVDYYTQLFGNKNVNLARLYLNKGVNTFINLNYNLSNLYHKKAVELYIETETVNPNFIKSLNNLCAINREIGDLSTSLKYGYQALSYNPSSEMKLLVYQNLAKTYEVLQDYNKAKEIFKEALKLVESDRYNPRKRFDLFVHYANLLFFKNDYSESYKYYKQALDIEGETNGYKTKKYAFVLSLIGKYYLKTEESPDKAMHYFNRSINIWQSYFNPKGSLLADANYHDISFATAYHGKSLALIKQYEVNDKVEGLFESLRNYEWLLGQLERINRNLQKENQEIVRGQLYPIYNEAIELAYKLYLITSNSYYQKKAFTFSEKSKSAILLSSMQNQNALKTSELPEELLRKDQNLNEEINAVKKQLFDENQKSIPGRKRVSFFETRLVQLLQSHDSLVRRLEKDYPKYYSLKYDFSIISFEKLSRKLNNDEALIEYQLFDSSLFIFTIRNKKLNSKKVVIDSLFYKSLDYFVNLKNTDLTVQTRSDFRIFNEHANRLYKILIEPVYSDIINKKLVIVPSGLLGYLPFELLVKPESEFKDLEYASLDYLLKEFPISYSYSSTLRFSPFFNNRSFKSSLNMLFMSPSYTNISDSLGVNSGSLKELPFAKAEVDLLFQKYGGKAFKGDYARKSTFLNIAPNFDVLHLAMHTIINDSLPSYSKLVFSSEGSDSIDSFLHTSEIYSLNLRASMVTLSACNTGTGVLQQGEGIMSLARGFVFAGVPSVVMTLWEVQDESGLEIMDSFYAFLADGHTKDEAMQLAKLKMLNSANMLKAHPNYWSAYIVTGDPSALKIVDEKNNVWILLLLIAIFVSVFVIYRRIIRTSGGSF